MMLPTAERVRPAAERAADQHAVCHRLGEAVHEVTVKQRICFGSAAKEKNLLMTSQEIEAGISLVGRYRTG